MTISKFQVVGLIKLEEDSDSDIIVVVVLVVGTYVIHLPHVDKRVNYGHRCRNLELDLSLIINVGRKLALKRLANRDHRIMHMPCLVPPAGASDCCPAACTLYKTPFVLVNVHDLHTSELKEKTGLEQGPHTTSESSLTKLLFLG
jgi:hypothetical protein